MLTLDLLPTHVLKARAERAETIAAAYGLDGPRQHRIACKCRAEIAARRTAESRDLARWSVPTEGWQTI